MAADSAKTPKPRLRQRLGAWLAWSVEPIIESIIWLCGWSAILFVFAIFYFVFREGAPFLINELDLGEFFTTTNWSPTSSQPQYGILGLLAGTLSVTFWPWRSPFRSA